MLESEPKPEWDSFALKTGYVKIMQWLATPMRPRDRREIEGEWALRVRDMQLSADFIESIDAARHFLLREARKPSSEPISRPCLMTARPTRPTRRRRQCNSGSPEMHPSPSSSARHPMVILSAKHSLDNSSSAP